MRSAVFLITLTVYNDASRNWPLLAPDETRRTRLGQDDALPQGSVVMAWLLLIVAGLLEVGWAIGLKYTDGFRRPLASVLTIVGIGLSMLLLSIAARSLPIGTAYAVWVGIGAAGTALLGIWLLGEPANLPRLLFLGLLVIAIVGLKFTSP